MRNLPQSLLKVLFSASILLLVSCANMQVAQLEKDMNARLGNMTYNEAVKLWGPPQSESKLDSGEIVSQWAWSQDYTSPAHTTYNTSNPYAPTSTTTGGDTRVLNERLIVTFDQKKKMSDWRWSRQ